jgi:hypothetical protein
MRPTFGREYVENEFQRIADGLSDPLTVYLIGGGAMSVRNLKGATKEVDWRTVRLRREKSKQGVVFLTHAACTRENADSVPQWIA